MGLDLTQPNWYYRLVCFGLNVPISLNILNLYVCYCVISLVDTIDWSKLVTSLVHNPFPTGWYPTTTKSALHYV
jgi:hypothetical protein